MSVPPQTLDANSIPVNNVFVPIGAPIVLASGATSNAFLKTALVEISARTTECFYIVGTAPTATANDHPLAVGASRQIQIPKGYKISNTGGELRITIQGAAGNTVAEFYA